MDAERREKLIDCIENDDVKVFGEMLCPEILSASIGRFPILSLVYLFSARKIEKKYHDILARENGRTRTEGSPRADRLFREKAGKSLRYFTDRTVEPLEMLALLKRRRTLVKEYALEADASRHLAMIRCIYYTDLGKEASVVNGRLRLPYRPFSHREKRVLSLFSMISLLLALVIAGLTALFSAYYGMGDNRVYTKVYESVDLSAALKRSESVYLKRDIALSGTAESYDARFDGQGKTIRLKAPFVSAFSGDLQDVVFVIEKDFKGEAVILSNRGTLRNVTVVFEEGAKGPDGALFVKENGGKIENLALTLTASRQSEVPLPLVESNEGSLSGLTYALTSDRLAAGDGGGLLVKANDGVIENATVTVTPVAANEAAIELSPLLGSNAGSLANLSYTLSAKLAVTGEEEHRGLIVNTNDGTIDQVSATVEIDISKEASKDCFFAPIAGQNNGTVRGCTVSGRVAGVNTDIAGIVGENELNGSVLNCFVNATLTEEADIKGWTPNVGGIVAQNRGRIESCTMKGKVVSRLNAPFPESEEDGVASAYAAGIVCVNCGEVSSCVNESAVSAFAVNGYAYAGGIATLNAYETMNNAYIVSVGSVTNASGLGMVTATSTTHNAYAGGIAAQNNNQNSISSCRQTAAVSAHCGDGDKIYSYSGGIVGYNLGGVMKSFFTGTLPKESESDFVGSICGLVYVYYSGVPLAGNAYLDKGVFASGALISEVDYNSQNSDAKVVRGYIYSADFFKKEEKYQPFIDYFLKGGATAFDTEEALKEWGYYYE